MTWFDAAVLVIAIFSGATASVVGIGSLLTPLLAFGLIGERIPFRISPARFGQVVGVAIGALGLWLLVGWA